MERPRLRDVAARAGVHVSTASRALNPQTRPLVRVATLRRVDAAAASLGYETNAIARSLRTRRTSTVGLLIPDLTNLVFPPTVRGIEDGLVGSGYTVLLVNTDNDRERELRQLEALRSRQVDGLILATATRGEPPVELARPSRLPLVLLYDVVEGVEAHSVVIDDATGTRKAVEHLRQLGHQRIAYVAGPQTRSPAVERLQAFRQAIGDQPGHELVEVCLSFAESEGAEAFDRLLDAGHDFTAVVAASDQLALGIYDALERRGLSCPDDYSVVGFHDVPLMDKLRPGLTTIRVPHHLAGVEAARLLLGQLDDPDSPGVQVRVPVQLVVRGSTAAPRPAGPGRRR
jgi:LacI family transcriptional regulator